MMDYHCMQFCYCQRLIYSMRGIWRCREVGQQFLEFVSRQCSAEDAVPVLIAHNGRAFDVPWIAAEFARSGLQLPADWHFLDTYQLARRALKEQLQGPQGPGFSQASVGTPLMGMYGFYLLM